MEIRVAELRDILKLLSPVIPRTPSLPVLTNVLLKDSQVTGTNLETMVRIDLREVDGECLLPQKKALELLQYVQGNIWVTIEQKGKTVKLSWEEGNAEFSVDKPEDYPDVRDIVAESEGTITDGDSMVRTLREMLTYRTTDESRPILSGVTVSFGETMEICAGDGYRMAYQTLPLAYPAESRVTIPAGSIELLCTLWDKVPAPITPADTLVKTIISKRPLEVSLSSERLIAHFGKITILSNLIQGTAPNFAQLIPKDPPLKVTVLAPDLERCVNRVKGIAQSGKGAIRLSWSQNKMVVSAKVEDNSASAEIGVASNDTGGRIAINCKYLQDYLTKKEGVVTIGISNENSPVLLRYGKSPLVVVMPMNVDWEDQKSAVEEPEPAVEEPEPAVEEPENIDELADDPENIDEPVEPEASTAKKPKKSNRRK